MGTFLSSLAGILLLLPSSAFGQWQQLSSLGSKNVSALMKTGAGIFVGLSGADTNFLFSADEKSWRGASLQRTDIKVSHNAYAFAMKNDTLLLATDYFIWRSTDTGKSWTIALTSTGSFRALAQSRSIVFEGETTANDNDGIKFSTDFGTMWWPPKTGNPPGVLSLLVLSDTIFAAGYSDAIYWSTNRGIDWSVRGYTEPFEGFNALARCGTTLLAGGTPYSTVNLLLSTDFGRTWTSNGGPGALSVYSLVTSGSTVFAGTSRGVWVSSDFGASWSDLNRNVLQLIYTNVNCLAIYDNTLYAGTSDYGVWHAKLADLLPSGEVNLNQPLHLVCHAYPNPSATLVKISLSLPAGQWAAVDVVDALGKHVASLCNEALSPVEHSFMWDARNAPAGTYFAVVRTGDHVEHCALVVAH